ncbi:type II secretion system F family protein [Streptomyces fumanus]|uniref:Membrane protein n=1 Tax=Streptomyces fumanus TaxID=67302 RepID=A0A919A5U9_9ACTN|nr:type II secretion system F family protein [Streptomyces fumanus]GHE88079.1 membrane protein [Streptomyces fumanus]
MSTDVVHGLGVMLGTLLPVGWLVRWAVTARRAHGVRHRLAGLTVAQRAPAAPRRVVVLARARPWVPLAAVVGAGWALLGGVAGLLAGLAVAAGLRHWQRRRAPAGTAAGDAEAAEAARQLPLAADLLAACIAAGAGPVVAARAVGDALVGPVGDALARGAAEVRLGGEPEGAWRHLAALPGASPLARLLERAGVSGLPAAGPVARLAAQARAEWARTTTARARRAAVMVSAPVGLCFLPAFIAVGILPVVIGLAGGVLGGGGGG